MALIFIYLKKGTLLFFFQYNCIYYFCFRGEKITKLCQLMGMDMSYDPDDTYELTTDNVKKIMAIYMRFRYYLGILFTILAPLAKGQRGLCHGSLSVVRVSVRPLTLFLLAQ